MPQRRIAADALGLNLLQMGKVTDADGELGEMKHGAGKEITRLVAGASSYRRAFPLTGMISSGRFS